MYLVRTTFKFLKYAIGQFFGGDEVHPDKYLTGSSKINIVFLPGFFTKRTQYIYGGLADALSDHGYKIYFIPSLGYNLKDIRTSARIVRDFMDENNLKNVVLFGHSKGGIIGKYILQHFNQDGRVLNLIAIGTPFAGLSFANYLLLKRFNEFGSHGKFIRDLTLYTKDNNKIYSIIQSKDSIIKDNKDMEIKGGNNIFLKTEGHIKSINSPENIDVMLKILGEISKKI